MFFVLNFSLVGIMVVLRGVSRNFETLENKINIYRKPLPFA